MRLKGRFARVIAVIAGISFISAVALNQSNHAESGHREIVLETTKSWNGTAYTHYTSVRLDVEQNQLVTKLDYVGVDARLLQGA
jgi:hypothetical protein